MGTNASKLLEMVLVKGASDLHLVVGSAPTIRVNTVLKPVPNIAPSTIEDINYFLSQILSKDHLDIFEINKEMDFSVALENKARFRVNAFYQKGYPSVALRYIPTTVPTLEQLNLPPVVTRLCELRQGLVLVVGPTGNGKSTTIAAMLEQINTSRPEHIITIEDPIEYVFTNKKSLIEQREMYLDTHSWDVALKSALRQDPNVVFLGEMRDFETMMSAMQIAETGHLVVTTLHTNSAAQTIDRIIASFPEAKHEQVKHQFAQIFEAVISQRLIPSVEKGMVPAVELLLATDAVRNLIREGKSHLIDNVISTGAQFGMFTLEYSLAELIVKGWIEMDDALKHSARPDEIRRLVKEAKKG